jgi:acyl-CoA synthetase (AMP-forming)/AMP-acid ligase II
LAGYKTPRSIVFLDDIPRNAAGKADRALVTRMVTERLRAEGASELEEEAV